MTDKTDRTIRDYIHITGENVDAVIPMTVATLRTYVAVLQTDVTEIKTDVKMLIAEYNNRKGMARLGWILYSTIGGVIASVAAYISHANWWGK